MRAGEAGEPGKKVLNLRSSLIRLVTAMTRKALICLLALFLIPAAHADSLKDALTHKYKNQVLALRSPFTAGDLKFDSAGQSLSAPPNSGWLLYGGIYVEKLSLSPDTLRLDGHRAASGLENKKLMLAGFHKSQRIEIHLDQPLKSLDEANAVMARVFFPSADTVQHAMPEFRRADDNIPDDQIFRISSRASRRPGDNAPEPAADRDTDGIVLPPKATYTPEPEFSEQARHAKYQGTVVLGIVIDKAGRNSRIRLERALGMGLDENAMEGVKQWRFTPGTRNGEPVAVAMSIEVSFNLY